MTVEAAKKLLQEAQREYPQWRARAREISRVGIFYTRWYPEIVGALRASAEDFLRSLEIPPEKIDFVEVSGSWELPLLLQNYLANAPTKVSFTLALGCIVKGETPHFDILCASVADALMKAQLTTKTPVGFGVLTVHSLDQARARLQKGAEAAEAAFRSWLALT